MSLSVAEPQFPHLWNGNTSDLPHKKTLKQNWQDAGCESQCCHVASLWASCLLHHHGSRGQHLMNAPHRAPRLTHISIYICEHSIVGLSHLQLQAITCRRHLPRNNANSWNSIINRRKLLSPFITDPFPFAIFYSHQSILLPSNSY